MLRMAEFSGDGHPVSITAVATTRDNALRAATPGDTIPGSDSQSVYLVVIEGKFELTHAKVPPGYPLPTGRYLKVTVNPSTLTIMDIGLSDNPPPVQLGTFGPVSNLTNRR